MESLNRQSTMTKESRWNSEYFRLPFMKRKKRNSSYRITVQDFIKANRKASREEEIAAHGSQVSFRRVLHKSRKQYDRKRLPKIREED